MATIDLGNLIARALSDSGDLMTLGDESGVEIDTHGPVEGNETTLEGYYTHPEDGKRFYVQATLRVIVEEFIYSPEEEEDDD